LSLLYQIVVKTTLNITLSTALGIPLWSIYRVLSYGHHSALISSRSTQRG